jgi:hypothetical protein
MNNQVILNNLSYLFTTIWTDDNPDSEIKGFETNAEYCRKDYNLYKIAIFFLCISLIGLGIVFMTITRPFSNEEKSAFCIFAVLSGISIWISLKLRIDSARTEIAKLWGSYRRQMINLGIIKKMTASLKGKPNTRNIEISYLKILLVSTLEETMKDLVLEFQESQLNEYFIKECWTVRKIYKIENIARQFNLEIEFPCLEKLYQ